MSPPNHRKIALRLKQAHGHLATILDMIEADRSCADLAQQIQAVEHTLRNAKRALIQDHVEHCVIEAMEDGGTGRDDAMREFARLVKYL
ncbi:MULTISPECIES: metal-sensing transcriptional repressor [Asaia]|uniref:metal-sensing transcriptional repressor n=1 Tax=Asaia TaxID=91914 RepID=UPI000EFB8106|nr:MULTISPECIES: metal-sensing transcriptional repressor [Asaia]NIE79378.1 metal-sensing transcriptional repressor [Asaia sp. As-1742]